MPDTAIIQTSTSQATVSVVEVGEVQIVEVSVGTTPTVIETGIVGPQGAKGSDGYLNLVQLEDVDADTRVDKSVLVYNAAQEKFVASPVWTVTTLTDGGNF